MNKPRVTTTGREKYIGGLRGYREENLTHHQC